MLLGLPRPPLLQSVQTVEIVGALVLKTIENITVLDRVPIVWPTLTQLIFSSRVVVTILDTFRTHSFDDSNPRAARNGRQPVQSDNNFVQGGRRRSWHNEQSTNFSTIFDTSDRKSPVHIAPIVIISTPESDETPIPDPVSSLTISPEKKPAPSPPASTDLNQDIHHNKKDRRPSIVKRNFRKIFGK